MRETGLREADVGKERAKNEMSLAFFVGFREGSPLWTREHVKGIYFCVK